MNLCCTWCVMHQLMKSWPKILHLYITVQLYAPLIFSVFCVDCYCHFTVSTGLIKNTWIRWIKWTRSTLNLKTAIHVVSFHLDLVLKRALLEQGQVNVEAFTLHWTDGLVCGTHLRWCVLYSIWSRLEQGCPQFFGLWATFEWTKSRLTATIVLEKIRPAVLLSVKCQMSYWWWMIG